MSITNTSKREAEVVVAINQERIFREDSIIELKIFLARAEEYMDELEKSKGDVEQKLKEKYTNDEFEKYWEEVQ